MRKRHDDPAIAAQADDWLAKLNTTNIAERQAFADWLLRSPHHVEAFLLSTASHQENLAMRLVQDQQASSMSTAMCTRPVASRYRRRVTFFGLIGTALGIAAFAALQILPPRTSQPPAPTYLQFNGETLSQAVTQLNRHNSRQILIIDPAIASLRISGRFNARDVDGFAAVLKAPFGIASSRSRAGNLRLTRAPPAETPPHSTTAPPFPAKPASSHAATR